MTEELSGLTLRQYEAALSMLYYCVDRCPTGHWNDSVGNLKYCQVAFHTLFFTDFYLCGGAGRQREQQFHQSNVEYFDEYEELIDREQRLLYDQETTRSYVIYCRDLAVEFLTAESPETLAGPCGVRGRDFSRAELHVYNIRHIQHHVGQMGLRLREWSGAGAPWVGVGWKTDF